MTSSLAHKAVVVTRALHQADELNSILRDRGAIPLSYPCIAIASPNDPQPLNQSARDLLDGAFDWVVFTSSNAVRAVAEALFDERTRRASSLPVSIKIAAIGSTTAQAVSDCLGVSANFVPAEHNAAHIAEELGVVLRPGARVFLPQSEIANPALREQLTAMGVIVTAVTAYRTIMGSGGDDVPALLRADIAGTKLISNANIPASPPCTRGGARGGVSEFAKRRVHAITFTSPSTVENFLHRLQAEGGQIGDLTNVCLACIGQTTTRAVERFGLSVHVTASVQSVGLLTDELEHYFAVERM